VRCTDEPPTLATYGCGGESFRFAEVCVESQEKVVRTNEDAQALGAKAAPSAPK
jgi:hypothetical protein